MLVLLAVCILANSFFVNAETPHEGLEMKLAASTIEAEKPHEVLEMKQVRTSMAVSSNVGDKCDAHTSCGGTQRCCSTGSVWTCCPYTGGNCCVGGTHCCQSGTYCTYDLRCE